MAINLRLTTLALTISTATVHAQGGVGVVEDINGLTDPSFTVSLPEICTVTLTSESRDTSGALTDRTVSTVPLQGLNLDQIGIVSYGPSLVELTVEGNFFTGTRYPILDRREVFAGASYFGDFQAEYGDKACTETSCVFSSKVYMTAILIREPFETNRVKIKEAFSTLHEECLAQGSEQR